MKNILYTLAILLLFSCKSQNLSAQSRYTMNNLTPFIGTWEYQNGNEIFRVSIYEDNLYLKGDYWFIEVNNGVETIICESNYNIPNTNIYNGYVIFGGSLDGIKMGAQIDDNTIDCENGLDARKGVDGTFGLTIQSGCLGCPITAEWKVSIIRGMRTVGEPREFSIPTDVIMTKMN
ncbi:MULTISPECIES: DUF6705 family protein [Winogradskyella]|nr:MULTISPECIES: DUF6705 family protein [Winogradskyella]